MIMCADMNQNIENMVESLTNLVNDAKGVLRRFGEGNCSEKNGKLLKPLCSVNDSLERLYPSTGKAAVNAIWGWKAKRSKAASSSYPTFKKKVY